MSKNTSRGWSFSLYPSLLGSASTLDKLHWGNIAIHHLWSTCITNWWPFYPIRGGVIDSGRGSCFPGKISSQYHPDSPIYAWMDAWCKFQARSARTSGLVESRLYSLGVPHLTTTDDVYQGYYIPKGSMVFANAQYVRQLHTFTSWYELGSLISAMLHNEEEFPNPGEFIPERFMKDGHERTDIVDPFIVGTFGFGRRFVSISIFIHPF